MTEQNTILNEKILNIKPGDTIKVYQIIKGTEKQGKKGKGELKKEKIQVFEGLVLARKHGKEPGSTITVRKVIDGIGVEKIFPLHSPMIKKIEIIKRSKVRRSKLYYLREARGKRARLKTLAFTPEQPKQKEKAPEIEKTEELKGNKQNNEGESKK
jgi:large subunit ribosomal protein L19